ncbi:MAG: hypothetical protein ACR2FM_03375 [Candidatus Saccharimonadales bacterium]
MSEIKCNPYLFFKGDCREAMEFYKSIFGSLVDKYGVEWMVNITAKQAQ